MCARPSTTSQRATTFMCRAPRERFCFQGPWNRSRVKLNADPFASLRDDNHERKGAFIFRPNTYADPFALLRDDK